MSERNDNTSHSVIVSGRERMNVTGVCEVISFDECGVVLDTVMGTMVIDGGDLRITGLDLERAEVDICGKISGVVYAEKRRRKGLFGRE